MGKVDLEIERQWASFNGRLLMLGFGSIGRGVLPLLLRHIAIPPERIAIMSPEGGWEALAAAQGVAYETGALTPDNYQQLLTARLGPGDFVDIAPHRRHRVEWTTPDEATVWLVVFYRAD